MKFSIYEPNKEILYHYLSKYNLKELPISNLQMIFSCTDENSLRYEIQRLIQCVGNNILIAPLPVYEKMYKNEVSIIMESIKELLKDKKSSLIVDASFQKRWTINSIKNFPYVLKTANILQDVDKNAFREKPVILVAAGPSLSDEIENLRYIKEKGLAYIFSVGSAINALVEHDIYPDATCTYDPKERNQNVIKKVKDKNISNIPLIFGSSVGFETLNDYPGPMLHMITNQDTVSPTLLGASGNIKIVNDAPSIAVVTFQLLNLLGFSQIILVGQNLGFRDNQRFAEGINYSHIPNKLSIKEMQNALIVKDTEGNNIKTSEMYN
ncbi:motility associated factor glycosyltransferase family protein, partial [Heyndrickxia oleronia]